MGIECYNTRQRFIICIGMFAVKLYLSQEIINWLKLRQSGFLQVGDGPRYHWPVGGREAKAPRPHFSASQYFILDVFRDMDNVD